MGARRLGFVGRGGQRSYPVLVLLCRRIADDRGAHRRGHVERHADPTGAAFETLLTALINEFVAAADDPSILQQIDPEPSTVAKIAGLGLRFVVILDDYHLIQTRHIHDGIAFLLDHLPPHTGPGGQCQGMHLMIATRSDPPLHLARFRGRGQRAELRADDLRFTLEEVAAFLNQRMDLQLATDDITALTSRTEGWIAGLQMAAISIQGSDKDRASMPPPNSSTPLPEAIASCSIT